MPRESKAGSTHSCSACSVFSMVVVQLPFLSLLHFTTACVNNHGFKWRSQSVRSQKMQYTDIIVGPPRKARMALLDVWKFWYALGRFEGQTIGLVDTSDFCLVEGICQLWLWCLEEKVYALDESQKVSGDGFLPANWQGPGWEDNTPGVYRWHSSIQWVQS